jgi:putative membrane protein
MKYLWLIIFFSILVWSGIDPKDQFTWFLEVSPAILGFLVLAFVYKRFPLTPLLYTLILIHMIILMIGGHYTYAEVPMFDYIAEIFEHSRNNYDKVGHFAQGFIPAILAREILLRLEVVKASQIWLNYIILSIILGFSAFYELVEWWVALATGEDAEAFLGTQGYVWDTQSDMAWALFGGITALLTLSSLHDKQLKILMK